MDGIQLIKQERERQVSEEGFDAAHDEQWSNHELALAALCYFTYAHSDPSKQVPEEWPWAPETWKLKVAPVQNLVRAGALYLAAADRIRKADPRHAMVYESFADTIAQELDDLGSH